MNYFRQINKIIHRNYCSTSNKFYSLENLPLRSLIRVEGNQCAQFLQGLITNDINHLTRGSNAIYTMFLNKPGRLLYDSIIYKTKNENSFLIECDKEISNELKKHLQIFRVRRKIDINIDDNLKIWTAYSPKLETNITFKKKTPNEICYCPDPRLKSLGFRIIAKSTLKSEDITNIFKELNFKNEENVDYKIIRYRLGIGEGVSELPIGKCFPLESNCDYMHGISFHKGCYLGQEFTARTHHTGVIRKRIMPIELSKKLEFQDGLQVLHKDKVVGVVRGIKEKYALGLLRIEQVLDAKELSINGISCKTYQPNWWPKEAPVLEKLSN